MTKKNKNCSITSFREEQDFFISSEMGKKYLGRVKMGERQRIAEIKDDGSLEFFEKVKIGHTFRDLKNNSYMNCQHDEFIQPYIDLCYRFIKMEEDKL